jgi:hypothetical protein
MELPMELPMELSTPQAAWTGPKCMIASTGYHIAHSSSALPLYWAVGPGPSSEEGIIVLASPNVNTDTGVFVARAGMCGAATLSLEVTKNNQTSVVCADNTTGTWRLTATQQRVVAANGSAACSFMQRPGMSKGRPSNTVSFHLASQPYLLVTASNQSTASSGSSGMPLTLTPVAEGTEFAASSTFRAIVAA